MRDMLSVMISGSKRIPVAMTQSLPGHTMWPGSLRIVNYPVNRGFHHLSHKRWEYGADRDPKVYGKREFRNPRSAIRAAEGLL